MRGNHQNYTRDCAGLSLTCYLIKNSNRQAKRNLKIDMVDISCNVAPLTWMATDQKPLINTLVFAMSDLFFKWMICFGREGFSFGRFVFCCDEFQMIKSMIKSNSLANSLAFLDIKLSINDNGLSTSVHYKPTDSHSYLLHSSSHPQHVKNAIPFS